MIFLQLFWEFLKTGLFAVGGGLATLPFLKAITHKYTWFTANDLMDMVAVSESTPGPMGVNSDLRRLPCRRTARRAHGDVFARAAVGHHHHSGLACA